MSSRKPFNDYPVELTLSVESVSKINYRLTLQYTSTDGCEGSRVVVSISKSVVIEREAA